MKFLPYVNVKMGTKSVMRYSNGNTLPLTQMPFGMAAFCPQSQRRAGEESWFYDPDLPVSEGIRLTHQPSPWIGDYGTFLMMPQNDIVADRGEAAWSGFRPTDAVLRPDYLKIPFLRPNATFELTPTERGAAIRVTFGDGRPSYLSFLPVEGNYTYEYDEGNRTLMGSNDYCASGVAEGFRMYFAVRFAPDSVDAARTYGGEGCMHIAVRTAVAEARLGISYISPEQAIRNLEGECGDLSFEALRAAAEAAWEEKLGRLVIEEDEARMRTFYSCLYRTFLFPNKAYELDGEGGAIHYCPLDGSVRPGVRYANNGFWDTYRTVYPLYSLIAREEYAEMLEGFVNDYREGGWLPRWIAIGEVGCMPSTLIDAVIADAVVKGIGSRDVWEDALRGMLHHANTESADRRFGRNGAEDYVKYGYVPRDRQRESVNLTLDAAYGDWCIATVAEALGHTEYVETYRARAKNYKNLFDPETGFMRGRDRNGAMAENFDPCIWGGEYTEGSAWQNSFAVPHDIEGLAALYGGREGLLRKLDQLFAEAPRYRVHGYGGEIHEMTEMAAVDFGQCAISNQPSFHLPYLYAALGETEKCASTVRRMCDTLFRATPDGYPGDEDNGTMSAWYVLSCLGMYPLCPGKNEWTRIPPSVTVKE